MSGPFVKGLLGPGLMERSPGASAGLLMLPPEQQPYIEALLRSKPFGLLSPGNINLYNRPSVPNPDGSISTVRSGSYGNDAGQEVLIPTVTNEGQILPMNEAAQYWGQKGQNLGVFDTPQHADIYAYLLHLAQQAHYKQKP